MKSIEHYEQLAREARQECEHSGTRRWLTCHGQVASATTLHHIECNDCGAWLPLGPANDGGEHSETVAIEIRAAEIAALIIFDRRSISYDLREFTNGEYDGWQGWPIQSVDVERPEHAAGWLAREIYFHDVDGALATAPYRAAQDGAT